jgi:2-dehydro-3-deoxy-D-arabinonate dehydratase
VGVETSEDTLVDLTAISNHAHSVLGLLRAAAVAGTDIDTVARALIDRGPGTTISIEDLLQSSARGGGMALLPPVIAPEVWAAGVTYQDSMRERQAESGTPDVYAKVYTADRPEVFFKATAERVVPPFGEVGIRADSTWDVPEPELAFVLFDGKIAGYTCGNDMSSRSIEGANPLYLPQAKLYDRSCSIGPCFATPEAVGDAQGLKVRLTIERNGKREFNGESSTSKMKRTCVEIADWLQRHNPVPDGTTVLTGTGTIPPPTFTLKGGDVVRVEIENIGTLVNTVAVV